MAIYLLEIIVIAFWGLLTNNKKRHNSDKLFCIAAFAVIIIVAGLRKYTVGIDLAAQYAQMYSAIGEMSWNSIFKLRYEPGYSAFCKLLSYISKDQQFFIFTTSLICFGSVGLFIYRNSEDVRLGTLLFVMCNMMFMHMTAIRQSLAVAIVLFGSESLKRKKYIVFVIFVFIASLFHTSAWICLLFLLASLIPYRRKYVLILLCVFVTSILLARRLFFVVTDIVGMYEGYATKGNYGISIINAYTVFNSIAVLIIFILTNRFIFGNFESPQEIAQKRRKRFVIGNIKFSLKAMSSRTSFENEFLLYSMYFVLIVQSSILAMQIFSRLRLYFQPFLCIVIPQVVHRCPNRRLVKKLTYGVLLAYYVYTCMRTAPSNFGTIPFEFFWQ